MPEQNEPQYLYLISPPEVELSSYAQTLEDALEAGEDDLVGAFQLRLKEGGQASLKAADDETIRRAIEVLLPICQKYSVAFILNDNPKLAAQMGCDGVHIGQEDMSKTPVAMCRELMGEDAIIGVSCHASKHMAMDAAAGGADYVAYGAYHATKSKPMEKLEKYGTPDLEILEWWSTYTQIPCVAIGGMTPQNCAPMVNAGADFIAAVSAIWEHPDGASAAVKEFASVIRG